MSKLVEIESCWQCGHHSRTFDGAKSVCGHDLNNLRMLTDREELMQFPPWCPLPDTPEEKEDGE